MNARVLLTKNLMVRAHVFEIVHPWIKRTRTRETYASIPSDSRHVKDFDALSGKSSPFHMPYKRARYSTILICMHVVFDNKQELCARCLRLRQGCKVLGIS